MSAAVAAPGSTTGFLCMWNGTKDDQHAYVDYSTGKTNVNEPKKVNIIAHDIRTLPVKPSLAQDGYQLVDHTTSVTPEEMLAGNTPEGRNVIVTKYYAECKDIISRITDAPIVETYIFRIRQNGAHPRDFSTKTVANKAMTAASLPIAHVDRDRMTLRDGIIDYFGAEKAAELFKKHKRYAQINVWRSIDDSVKKWPLAFINHSGVSGWDYDSHMATVEPRNDPRVALRGTKAQDSVLIDAEGYKYYYVSDIKREEVLVFSSGDSDVSKVVPHGAFWDDKTAEDAPTRRSLEVRAWVFFDE
ncbi:hypothetical protein QBC35DRAFT_498141 [Podospora australis]|uniref:Uncharacterized protein n=1 Tax=Podospora australis TaxID=1536484 RepID=A0AAN6WTA3_9PEZI|nr:hypothetical protein QBC35DRAFT_498141 [Podospora australis]